MQNKLFFKIATLMLIIFLFAACSKNEPAQQEQPDANEDITEEAAPAIETASSACDNIFYPLALDNQWIYNLDMYQDNYEDQEIQSSASDLALTVSEVNDSSALLAALDYDTGVVTQTTVQCQDQAIVNFPITELNMIFGDLAGDINVEYINGTFMPSEKEFEGSDWSMEWETEYKANGNIEASFDGEALSAVLSESPVQMRWQITGRGESLEVPAGTFNDLVKINREISFDITSLKTYIDGSEVNLSTTLTIDTNMWYAPHIGLIKQEVNSASIKVYGINFPIDAWGFVELSSYTLN